MGHPAGRSGWVDACAPRATRTKLAACKALANLAKAGKKRVKRCVADRFRLITHFEIIGTNNP